MKKNHWETIKPEETRKLKEISGADGEDQMAIQKDGHLIRVLIQ